MTTVPPRRTWAPGDVDSGDMNGEIRDPLSFLFTGPYLHTYRSTAMTVNHDTYTAVTMFGDTYDRPDENHSTVTDTSRFVPATPGLWTIRGQTMFNPSSVGVRGIVLRRNSAGSPSGGLAIGEDFRAALTSRETTVVVPDLTIGLSVGDHVEMFAYQNSGGTLACPAGTWQTFLQCRWVGEL